MKTQLLLFCMLLLSCSQRWQQADSTYYPTEPSTIQRPLEAGKCYAKSIMPNQYDIEWHEVFEYTGNDYSDANIQLVEIELEPANSKWIKKPSPYPCKSVNPDDCMVLCLSAIPAVTESFYTVIDTTILKEFEITQKPLKVITKEGGYIDWTEVICDSKFSSKLISQIKMVLNNQGYKMDLNSPTLTIADNENLSNFQRKFNLPVGSYNIKTLKFLGIEY